MVTSEAVPNQLVSIVYVSSAAEELEAAELTDLLAIARERNRQRGVTGMLLYRSGDFLQVIEGLEPAVDSLLRSLRKDRRHRGMILLTRSKIQKRQFDEWEMAFQNINGVDLTSIEGYSAFMEKSFTSAEFRSRPGVCFKLLASFKDASR